MSECSTWRAFSKAARSKMDVLQAFDKGMAMPLHQLKSYRHHSGLVPNAEDLGTAWYSGEHNLGLALARGKQHGHTVYVSRQQPGGTHHHASYPSIEALYQHAKDDHHLFEVIASSHGGAKLFFDFDFTRDDFGPDELQAKPRHIRDRIKAVFCQHLNVALKDEDICMADSSVGNKCSYHVVIDGVYAHHLADIKHLAQCLFPADEAQWARMNGAKADSIADTKVYSRNQHFRALYQTKNTPGAGTKRPLGSAHAEPCIESFRRFWITHTAGCVPINQLKLDAYLAKSIKDKPKAFQQLTIPQTYQPQATVLPVGDADRCGAHARSQLRRKAPCAHCRYPQWRPTLCPPWPDRPPALSRSRSWLFKSCASGEGEDVHQRAGDSSTGGRRRQQQAQRVGGGRCAGL